jgi:hypothetical protein
MREYKWTLIGLILAMGLWVLSVRFHLDLFEAFISYLRHHEYAEIDKFIPPILLFCIFATIDLACRHQKIRIEIEKLKVYRSMLKAMNHILNNFLHKMLLFKLTAEETEGFDPEVLKNQPKKPFSELSSRSPVTADAILTCLITAAQAKLPG